MIGSNQPIRYSPAEVDKKSMELVYSVLPKDWKEEIAYEGDIEKLFEIRLIRDAEGIKEILAMEDVPVITDDRPIIEFLVTKNLLLGLDFKRHRLRNIND
jgi:hypothetical protein